MICLPPYIQIFLNFQIKKNSNLHSLAFDDLRKDSLEIKITELFLEL